MTTTGVDLVVAGGGMAGLTAALACVQAGLHVRVLEKRETIGGQAAIAAGAIWAPLYAAGTDAGGVFGRHYAGFLGWAVASGRRAGLSAAQGMRQGVRS